MSATGADLDAYARRLGFVGPLRPDLDTLRSLHRAHIRTVPFENASVLFGEPIEIDQGAFVRKLGAQNRGGFCYELNGAFAALLGAVGFEVAFLEARTYGEAGRLGPRHDHMALRVTLDEPWLADVGFGYSFVEPLRLSTSDTQIDPIGAFRLVTRGDGTDVEWRHRDGRWVAHYRFDPEPCAIGDFAATCRDQQTSPDSPFVADWLCSRIGDQGGVTLSDGRLIVTDGDSRSEAEVSEHDLPVTLAAHFGIHAARVDGRWVRTAG